jgi:hypothetical protein
VKAREEGRGKKDARGRPWLHFQSWGGTPGTPRNRVPSINERQLAVSRKSGKVHESYACFGDRSSDSYRA